MKHFLKTVGMSVVMAAGLVACGGGGDDSGSKSTPPTTEDVARVLQALKQGEALTTAKTGVYAVNLAGSNEVFGFTGYLSGIIIRISNTVGGSIPAAVKSCAQDGKGSGSYTVSTTKLIPRLLGLDSGDKLKITFNKCNTVSSGVSFIFDGDIEVTVQNKLAGLPLAAENVDLSYETKLTGFSIQTDSATPKTIEGVANLGFKSVSAPSSFTFKFNVPAGQRFIMGSGENSVEYKNGASFTLYGTQIVNYKLDGDIAFTKSGKTTAFVISTPTPISGADSSAATFVATSGVIDVKDATTGKSALATLSSTKAVISGSDFSAFDSSWGELYTAP
jgi:hypothetical protein